MKRYILLLIFLLCFISTAYSGMIIQKFACGGASCTTSNDEEPINDGSTSWGYDPGVAAG